MMTTAPPVAIDPSQLYLNIPPYPFQPPPAPVPPIMNRSKTRSLDILKVLGGFLIALFLAAILAALIFLPRTSHGNDSNENLARLERESNENVAKLERESNENIARLQREQNIYIEKERQKHQDDLLQEQYIRELQRLERQLNLSEQHRVEDRFIEQMIREQNLQITKEQTRQQLEMEQKNFDLLLKNQILTEEHRQDALRKENDDLLWNFMQEVNIASKPLNPSAFEYRVKSLIRRFDTSHKSLLISFLYKVQLVKAENPNIPTLDLQRANLKEINLDETDPEYIQSKYLS